MNAVFGIFAVLEIYLVFVQQKTLLTDHGFVCSADVHIFFKRKIGKVNRTERIILPQSNTVGIVHFKFRADKEQSAAVKHRINHGAKRQFRGKRKLSVHAVGIGGINKKLVQLARAYRV